jgi:FKBP-type peptidyl-prolyl cis-trans isomerase FklB
MKKLLCALLVVPTLCGQVIAQNSKGKAPAKAEKNTSRIEMKTLLDSFSYAAGVNIAENMKGQGITTFNLPLMMEAFVDVLSNKPTQLSKEQANMTLQKQLQAFQQKKLAIQKEKETIFLNSCKAKKGVISLPSGLQYEILKAGEENGMKPTPIDTVVVDYVGTLVDGTEFDNSIKRGQPAEFPVGGVIKGWTEILQLMTKGAHWKVYIPSELGYGERGAGSSIPPGATLIFEITLKDIKPAVAK